MTRTIAHSLWLLLIASLWFAGCGDDEARQKTTTFGDTGGDALEETTAPDSTSPPDTRADAPGDTRAPDAQDADTQPPVDTGASDGQDGDGSGDSTPVTPATRSCATEIVYTGAASSTVTASGDFNGWSATMTPLEQRDGAWRTEVVLPAGHHAFKFVIDGEYESSVPPDVYTHWAGDDVTGYVENRDLSVIDCQRPGWQTLTLSVDDAGLIHGEFQFVRAVTEAPIDPASVTLSVGGVAVTPTIDVDSGVVSFDHQAPAYGKHTVWLGGADSAGAETEGGPHYVPFWYEAAPFAWRDAVMYLIFTDRFLDTDGVDRSIPGAPGIANYQGGDFPGITQKIEEGYFDQLGVNTLWISPIYDNTDTTYPSRGVDFNDPTAPRFTGFHGYWPISYEPEPRYGNGDHAAARTALRALVDAAHARGMRIVFDIALNHVHEDHEYCSENSSWCPPPESTCLCGTGPGCGWDPWDGGIDCLFDWFLPDVNYRRHELVERVIEDTLELIKTYDVDGLRIDAARHMNHVIMRTLRMTLRDRIEDQGGAPYYTVGETFSYSRPDIMNYVADHELHGQFDFPMMQALRNTFGPSNAGFDALDGEAAASEAPDGYGGAIDWMSPFFGNHDVDRFATVIAGNKGDRFGGTPDLMAEGPEDTVTEWDIINRMTLAFAFLHTYRGIPLIYYGDEIGLAGSDDPDNRRMMIWDLNENQRTLLARAQQLGQARRDIPALRRGGRREIWRDGTLYVYVRDASPGEAAIIAMARESRAETISVPPEFGLEGLTLESYNSTRSVTVSGGTIAVELDPWEYAIFYTAP